MTTGPATRPAREAWEAHLDGLEQWVRACAQSLTRPQEADDVLPPEPPRGEPLTPLPAELGLRARLLVAAMEDVVSAGAARRAVDDRAARYRTA
jgi:hypothetical protein